MAQAVTPRPAAIGYDCLFPPTGSHASGSRGTPAARLSWQRPLLRPAAVDAGEPLSTYSARVAALGSLAAALLAHPLRGSGAPRRPRPGAARPRVARRSGDGEVEALDDLAAALELAERGEDFAGAARLRDRLREAEAASPIAALRWRQQRRVKEALERALYGPDETDEARLAAVSALTEMASPPAAALGAEDALHRILREASGELAPRLRDAAEGALWDCWTCSGEEEVDTVLRKGMALMDRRRLEEAVDAFTTVIQMAPSFAEGWNKRATAWYVLRDFEKSIQDCAKVLELKPRHFGCLSGLGMVHRARGDETESLKWFRAALEVHPCMEGPQGMVLNAIAQDHLSPRVGEVAEALRQGVDVEVELADGLTCTWDVHRVMPQQPEAHVYFFRVSLRNEASAERTVKSLARYYVLQFADGKVFPFTRVTEGAAGYVLQPGQEYRFCWALIVARELRGMAGGALLERISSSPGSSSGGADCYLRPSMGPVLRPASAPEVDIRDMESLGGGYFFTGQLDLRTVTGV